MRVVYPSRRSLARLGVRAVVPAVVLVVWWFGSAHSRSPYFPPLRTILSTFRQMWLFADVGPDLVPSLERMLLGYGIAVVVGVAGGVLLGRVELLRRAFDPLVQFGRSVPGTALVPIAVVVLGIGNTAKVTLIAFVCLFPILLNTIDGVHAVEPIQLDVARSFQLTRAQTLRRVLLPGTAPQVATGMRISLGAAFVMMVVTEMVAATNGIGYVTLAAEQQLQIPQMWAGMLLLGVLGYVLNLLFVAVEHRVLGWHRGQRAHQGAGRVL